VCHCGCGYAALVADVRVPISGSTGAAIWSLTQCGPRVEQ